MTGTQIDLADPRLLGRLTVTGDIFAALVLYRTSQATYHTVLSKRHAREVDQPLRHFFGQQGGATVHCKHT